MSDYTLFHLPLTRSGSKNSTAGVINSYNPHFVLHASTPSNDSFSYAEGSTPPTPPYQSSFPENYHHSADLEHEFDQSDLVDPFEQLFQPTFQEARYHDTDRYFTSNLMEMASPSKNNFARQIPRMMREEQEDNDYA
jgi:hypothetical protein